jgi:hypothetical protein
MRKKRILNIAPGTLEEKNLDLLNVLTQSGDE